MTDNLIRAALDDHLSGIPAWLDDGSIPLIWTETVSEVAWPNTHYKPDIGTGYFRPTLLPADVSQAELGEDGRNEHIGLYQVDVIAPIGKGRIAAETNADAVLRRFRRGTLITYRGITVRCDAAKTLPGRSETDWFILPVQIDYRAYLSN